MSAAEPCLHFSHVETARCLIGRRAPHDCGGGCPAYATDAPGSQDLPEHERIRCEVWSRVMGDQVAD